jgi:signal transduction histidine kinase
MNASQVFSNHPIPPGRADDIGLYRRIAQELPHGAVFVVDREMRYVVAQGAELEAAGFTPSHFEGRTVREAVPSSIAAQYENDYRTVFDGGSFERAHEINQRHYRSYGMPLKDDDGRPQLALVVSYDVTGQVLAERQKDKAIAILGHELRNPLATLNMGVALLKRAGNDNAPPGAVELMERQVRQMTRMVDDLLGLAFLAHGRMELRRERCDVAALVEEVLASLESCAAHKRQTLRHVRSAGRPMVDADYCKLTQVLTNLLGNAIKYPRAAPLR